jgi:hypothetical protein
MQTVITYAATAPKFVALAVLEKPTIIEIPIMITITTTSFMTFCLTRARTKIGSPCTKQTRIAIRASSTN